MEQKFDETEFYLWKNLDRAVQLRKLEEVIYWQSKILIHRANKNPEEPVIQM